MYMYEHPCTCMYTLINIVTEFNIICGSLAYLSIAEFTYIIYIYTIYLLVNNEHFRKSAISYYTTHLCENAQLAYYIPSLL